MKKIFTLAFAVLASFGLWAQSEPDVAVDAMTDASAATYFKSYGDVTLLYAGEYQKTGNNYNIKADQTNNSAYVGITSTKELSKVAFLVTGNGSNKNINAGLIGHKTVAETPNFTAVDYASFVSPSVAIPSANYSDAQWVEFDLSDLELKAVYFSKQWKNVSVSGAANANFPSSNAQSLFVYGIRVWVAGESVTYTATYKANNGSAEADSVNTAAKKVAGAIFTAPEGKKFAGWNTAADGTGTDYEIGAALTADVTLYAQWVTVCYEDIFNFNEALGTARVKAATAGIIDNDTLRLSDSNGRIVLIPGEGSFKNGDIIEFAGIIGNSAKNYGIKIWAANGSTTVGTISVPGTTDPLKASGVLNLSADQDSLVIGRADGTTTTLTSLVIKRESTNCKEIVSTVDSITAVTVNGDPLSAAQIALINDRNEDYWVFHDQAYATAPTVVFTKHSIITYDDESTKVKDEDIEVVAEYFNVEFQGEFWRAALACTDKTFKVDMSVAASAVITYMDGETVLGSETIAKGSTVAEYAQYESKELATFGGWYNDAALTDPVDLSVQTFNADATIYGKFTKAYASSINIEQIVLDNGKGYDIRAALTAGGFAYKNINDLDSLNDEKTARNEPYLGLKIKAQGGYIACNLRAGDVIRVKFGYVTAAVKAYINDQEMTLTPEGNALDVLEHTATAETFVKLQTTTGGTVVIKQIMINEAIADVTLPDAPAPDLYTVTLGTYEHGAIAIADLGNVDNKFQEGDTVRLTITPDEGYELESISLDGLNLAVTVEGNSATFKMPAQDVTVLATFKAVTPEPVLYTVTLGTYEHGAVAIADLGNENKYEEGNDVHLTITPDEGYELESISLDGLNLAVTVDGNSATFKMPAQDVTVLATFKAISQGLEDVEASQKAVKRLENGMLIIEKNGAIYNIIGARVK